MVVGLAIGFSIGYTYLQPRLANLSTCLSSTEEELSAAIEKIERLQSDLRDLQIEKSRLEALLSTANASLLEAKQEIAAKKAELEGALEDLRSARGQITNLNEKIVGLNEKIVGLNEKITELNKEIAAKDREIVLRDKEIALRDERTSSAKKAMLRLDDDRKLLVYMRMELPDERQEAIDYWNTVKNLSIRSDPSLGPSVDAIIANIDAYFNWYDARPTDATQEEWLMWILEYSREAYRYDLAIRNFRREAFLVIIVHIDTAVDLLLD